MGFFSLSMISLGLFCYIFINRILVNIVLVFYFLVYEKSSEKRADAKNVTCLPMVSRTRARVLPCQLFTCTFLFVWLVGWVFCLFVFGLVFFLLHVFDLCKSFEEDFD